MEKRDNQITGMSGECLAAGKLCKKELQVSITFGNAKAIDIMAYNPKTDKNYNIQVKTSRKKNDNFQLKKEDIKPEHIYIFIILNDFEKNEDFFIVKGSEILNDIDKFFGAYYRNNKTPSRPAVYCTSLMEYKDNWKMFDE